ncbi:ComEC/Rec2 family competence protein [Microbacterium sp. ZW T5_45]|uniref:ComEC/Rec2 family competence protein n=1 Tax=Microbacterium sp. ZW T5_45 TaxID=3378080 RepID=UPI003853307E
MDDGRDRRDLRLLPVAVCVWGSALLGVFVPSSAAIALLSCLLGAAMGVVLLVIAGRRSGARRGGLPIVVLVAAAAVSLSVVAAMPSRTAAAEVDGRVVEVVAEISSSASIGRDGRLWFDAETSSIGGRSMPAAVVAPVRIGVDPADGFDLGARIRVVGEALGTDAGERAALVVFASEAEVVRPAEGVFAVAADARTAFIERATRLPEPGAGLLPGLAVGDTRAVSTELNDDMRASGLSHLTAVSGANCAIVVGAVFWIVALGGGGRGLRVTLAAAALGAFVVLVTPEPSVIRAAVMAGIAMLTVLLGRPSAGAGLLALCSIGILIGDPWLSATPGFALSVAASGALILLASPLARGLERAMPRTVALAIAVPLAAQLVCGPIIALFAEQQSLVGVAANMIAGPAAPIATVIGLLACLAAPFPALADLLAAAAWLPSAWIAMTAHISAGLPLAQITLVPGMGSALLVAVVSGAVAVVLARARGGGTPLPVWTRRIAGAVVVIVVSASAGQLLLRGPLATATTPDGWAIAACDVGQGDALVVRSEGMIALIDTGPDPEPLRRCLQELGVTRIDLLVLTHFDLDHVGGTSAVEGIAMQVLHGPTASTDDERILADLADGGARLVDAAAGLEGALGAARWRVLWPLRSSAVFPSGNDASVILEIAGGQVPRSLFLGDLSAESQRMLMRTARLGSGFAVVKVAHHGSADQEPDLYESIRPTVAVISVGEDNDYGHPRQEILDVLDAIGAHVLRTDQRGRILLGMREDELEVWTEKSVGAPG